MSNSAKKLTHHIVKHIQQVSGKVSSKVLRASEKVKAKVNIEALPKFAQAPARHVVDTVLPNHRNNFRPHALRHRSLALISLLMLSVKIVTIAVVTFGPVLPALSSAITQANVAALTNQSRAANNLSGLTYNSKLEAAAQSKANDMLAKQYFSHVTPDNKQPWDFISAQGYAYQGAGENLGVGFNEAESLESAWMNSPGHRANILNSSFKEIGVGIAVGNFQGKQSTIVVQMFGIPMGGQVSSPAPKPAPVDPKPAPPVIPRLAPPVPTSQPVAAAATAATAPAAPTPTPAAPAPPKNPPQQIQVAAPPKAQASEAKAQTKPAPAPVKVASESISVSAPSIPAVDLQINKNEIQVTVETSSPADKVTAVYGNNFLEMQPNPNSHTLWQVSVPVAALTESKYLNVRTEKEGTNAVEERLALFDNGFKSNYDLSGRPEPKLLNLFGIVFDPELLQNQFYLLMIALMTSLLVVAIAVRVKVQHLDLISNTAFVVVLATLLWYSGIQNF